MSFRIRLSMVKHLELPGVAIAVITAGTMLYYHRLDRVFGSLPASEPCFYQSCQSSCGVRQSAVAKINSTFRPRLLSMLIDEMRIREMQQSKLNLSDTRRNAFGIVLSTP